MGQRVNYNDTHSFNILVFISIRKQRWLTVKTKGYLFLDIIWKCRQKDVYKEHNIECQMMAFESVLKIDL